MPVLDRSFDRDGFAVDVGLVPVGARIPHDHGTRTVLAFGDHTLEPAVLDGVILDFHRETFCARIQRGTLRDGPGFQHPVGLEPEVVVQG